MKRYIWLCGALLVLHGCASGGRAKDDAAGVAAAMRTAAQFRATSYRLGPSDLLAVGIYPDQQLSRKARVEADGAISLPLIGTATVAGMTVLEAERAIQQKLSRFLVNAHVSLVVEEYGNRHMFVLGEVQAPGSYAIPAGSRLTVLQAVSLAGGFTKVAAPARARVLRYVNGKPVEHVVDLKAVARGEDADKDILLEPNDVVYVPQSLF